MKLILSLIILLSAASVSASESCFRGHVREFIHINKERKAVYQDREASKVFNKLIFYEYLVLLPARYYDRKARLWQNYGMDLLCQEFKSGGPLPDFDPAKPTFPVKPFKPFDWKKHKRSIKVAIKSKDAAKVRSASLEALHILKESPQHLCMTRHLVESIYRFAHFAPIREKEAEILGLPSPENLLFSLMGFQLHGFKGSYKLDLQARPLQDKGYPVLCAELPNLIEDLEADELKDLK